MIEGSHKNCIIKAMVASDRKRGGEGVGMEDKGPNYTETGADMEESYSDERMLTVEGNKLLAHPKAGSKTYFQIRKLGNIILNY